MTNEQKTDRRIRRTRRQLHTAIHNLIQDRSYDAISVSDIVDEADISRATFYLHYKDKDELLLHSLETLSQQWIDDLHKSENTSLKSIAQAVFDHVAAHRSLYQALQTSAPTAFVIQHQTDRLVDLMTPVVMDIMPEQATDNGQVSRVAHQLAGMVYGQLVWWLKHDLKPPAATMAEHFDVMSMRGIMGLRD